MMSCPEIHALSAFFDDQMAPAARAQLERHVVGCAPCAAQLAGFAQTRADLRALRDVSAPARLLAQLAAAVPRRSPTPGLSTCAAAALLGGLSLLLAATAFEPWRRDTPLERHLERARPLFDASADQLLPPELALLRELAAQERRR